MSDNNEFLMGTEKPAPRKLKVEEDKSSFNEEARLTNETLKLDKAQKNLVNVYKNEKKVPVRVAPSYAKYFGKVMRVSINGISVAVKCDGQTVQLPETFATEVMRRMNEMDAYELNLSKMGNVQQNVETSPGQLNFFN